MKDAKSTTTFIQALNESLESGALMCQLYNAELSKYIMNLTNAFCRKQIELGVPKVKYVKQAAECLGKQPDSCVWVMNDKVHFNEEGKPIQLSDSKYIWLGSMLSNRTLSNVAPASDAALIPLRLKPEDAFEKTLLSLKQAVHNNYVPAFMLIASAGMAVHYQLIMEKYGMCPMPVAIGLKNTGKSTAAKAALALLGTPQFFVREFTATQTIAHSSRKTFPTVFDDPDDLSKIKSFIDNTFNGGARATSRATSVSRCTGIITLNFDRIKHLCRNYKLVHTFMVHSVCLTVVSLDFTYRESSRIVFIPFQTPQLRPKDIDDSH